MNCDHLQIAVLCLIIASGCQAAPASRERRSLGLLKYGYNLVSGGGSGGFSSGVAAGVADSFAGLSTAAKIGTGLVIAKPLALGLLGKCNFIHQHLKNLPKNAKLITDALYDWLVRGSNAGVQADVGLGPSKLSSNAGFAIKNANQEQQIGGTYTS